LTARFALIAAAFFLVALATSRVTLVGHELVGHGALAVLLGADLLSYKLFLFGGGWVSYRWGAPPAPAEQLAVALGGIGFELVAGAIALWLSRRRPAGSLSRVALLSVATIVLLHGGFYLAAGAHHGFGDGRAVHEALGAWRPLLVVPVALAVIGGGYLLARRLAREVTGWLPVAAWARAGLVAGAAVLAAGAHGALAWGERALERDQTYARIMQHESTRRVAVDLDRYAAEARRMRGRAPSRAELEARRAALEEQHRRFPLALVLAVGLGLACLAGLWRSARERVDSPPPARRALIPLAAACAASIALVAVLQALA
jgi:hypothetical protein